MEATTLSQQKSESKYAFSTVIPVRINDVNYGNHLDAAKIAGMLHHVRVLFLNQHGLAENNIDDCTLTTRSLNLEYKAPAFFNDQLEFHYGLGEGSRATAETIYHIRDKEKDIVVANASIVLSFINNQTNRPTRVPKRFMEIFNGSDTQT